MAAMLVRSPPSLLLVAVIALCASSSCVLVPAAATIAENAVQQPAMPSSPQQPGLAATTAGKSTDQLNSQLLLQFATSTRGSIHHRGVTMHMHRSPADVSNMYE